MAVANPDLTERCPEREPIGGRLGDERYRHLDVVRLRTGRELADWLTNVESAL